MTSRSHAPRCLYVIAALLASAAMAWYFFVFVPTKLDYFVGLRFRTLAVASGNVASKIDSLARALDSVPKPTDAGQNSPCSRPPSSDEASYVALVLPEIQLSPAGDPAQGPQFRMCHVTAWVAWADVAKQAAAASRRDFDDLIIADAMGDVVWQRENATPRIGNVSELLAAPDDSGGWSSLSWRERATMPAKKDAANLRSSAVLKAVNLGGTATLLLVQAVSLADRGIVLSANGTAKADDSARLYVAGLIPRARLQQEARRIPAAWVVLIALPIMVLFLATPFVKLATLTSKERYRFSDVVLMILATVAASGLGAMIPFVAAPPTAPDATLENLATTITDGLKHETRQVLELARIVRTKREQIEEGLQPCEALASGLPTLSTDPAGKQACQLWPAFDKAISPADRQGLSIDLDVVIWFDQTGKQIRKWTTKRQVTGPTTHRPFDHYRAATTNQLWTLADDPPASANDSLRRFMIDPLRAPTTSELGVVFVTPALPPGKEKPTTSRSTCGRNPSSIPWYLLGTDSRLSPRRERCSFIRRRDSVSRKTSSKKWGTPEACATKHAPTES